MEWPQMPVFKFDLVAAAFPPAAQVHRLAVEYQVADVKVHSTAGGLHIEDAETIEFSSILLVSWQKWLRVGFSIDHKCHHTSAILARWIVTERPRVCCSISRKWFRRCRLITISLEAAAAAREPVARAVFVKHPIPAAIAVDAECQRVRRAPPAGLLVEPAEQHTAAPTVVGHREFPRSRKFICQRARRNHLRKPRRRQRSLHPPADRRASFQ